MTDREAMKLALEALEINLPIAYAKNGRGERFPCFSDDPLREIKTREAITALRQALEQPDPFSRLVRIMGTFDLSTGHADNWNDLLDSLESELRDVLGHYREALKVKQEPVAYRVWDRMGGISFRRTKPDESEYVEWDALYTAPPKREFVGLTDDDIAEGIKQSWVEKQAFESAVWWAEEKLKEKNT